MTTTTAPRHPGLDLLARYAAILRAAWAARRELAGPKRLTDELAFLPAALSLQETPAHPAPRRAAFLICALFVAAITWACIGQIDIVAVAPGRIVVSERTKTLQPLEKSVVKRVLVKDGDSVQAGQVLVELDATITTADTTSVQEQLNAAAIDEERAMALMAALKTGRPPTLATGADPARIGGNNPSAATQLYAEWLDISARLSRLRAEQSQREAEIATVRELIVAHRAAARGRHQRPGRSGLRRPPRRARPYARAHRAGTRPRHPTRAARRSAGRAR